MFTWLKNIQFIRLLYHEENQEDIYFVQLLTLPLALFGTSIDQPIQMRLCSWMGWYNNHKDFSSARYPGCGCIKVTWTMASNTHELLKQWHREPSKSVFQINMSNIFQPISVYKEASRNTVKNLKWAILHHPIVGFS